MGWTEDASPAARTAPAARGSPTRRRLLILLGGAAALGLPRPTIAREAASTQAVAPGSLADPMPRLFAEFRALLDRHEAALAACDRIEATLVEQIGYPRVVLPIDWEGARRHAVDAHTVTETLPPGRHRRRLLRILQRRQRDWDRAARGAGLTAALLHEAALDEAVLDHADGLIATPARNLDAVVLKLVVLLATQEPSSAAGEQSPWREMRLILVDLRNLAGQGGGGL